jgi:hypothetical protein
MVLKIIANLNGGDLVTPDNELTYKIYGSSDNYASPIATLGSALNDAKVSVTAGVVTIDNVDVGTEDEFKISSVDEAGNESILSDAVSNFKGFLNEFSGASLGLSLILLDKNYTGFCMKVRRDSDNNELDIGFVNNELDTASLLTFAGAGDAFVTIIYDQVGGNNMTNTTASLQGQIVSNGSVILRGGKPCIIRSSSNNGGYISTYAPNDGATVKGVFYVGDNESKTSIILGSATGSDDFLLVAEKNSINSQISESVIVSNTKLNGISTTFSNRNDVYIKTNLHFLIYQEIDFNFEDNNLGLGYKKTSNAGFGMFTFQEQVIFENTNDTVAKENNINSRYNIY